MAKNKAADHRHVDGAIQCIWGRSSFCTPSGGPMRNQQRHNEYSIIAGQYRRPQLSYNWHVPKLISANVTVLKVTTCKLVLSSM